MIARANLRIVVMAASKTICVSEAERAALRSVVGDALAARASVIHNGVPIRAMASGSERLRIRAELGISADDVVCVWVGGLDPHKDPETVIRAAIRVAESHPGFILLLVGDGPLRTSLENEVAGESPAIRILGQRNDVGNLCSAADLIAVSSSREGLSFALLDAMAAGLAPVVSAVQANVEAVGDAGIVVPAGDVRGFTAAFARLVSDVPLRVDLGRRARLRAIELFDVGDDDPSYAGRL